MSNCDFCSYCGESSQRLEEGVCPKCGAFGQAFVPEAEMSPATKRILSSEAVYPDDDPDQTDALALEEASEPFDAFGDNWFEDSWGS